MSNNAKRGAAAAGTFAFAALVNIATGMLTQRWTLAWVLATVIFVFVGAALQWWLSSGAEGRGSTQHVTGTKIGGTVTQRARAESKQSVENSEIGQNLSQEQR